MTTPSSKDPSHTSATITAPGTSPTPTPSVNSENHATTEKKNNKNSRPPEAENKNKPMKFIFNQISRAISYTAGHLIPLYLIIGAIIAIALPSSAKLSWWPFIQDTNTPPAQIATASQAKSNPATSTANEKISVVSSPTQIPPITSSLAQEDVKLTNIAKLAIDATKERIEMMKENYEKIFSFIAAFAALLAFLGFKGIETFTQTKNNAQEAEKQAKAAAQAASKAKEEAQAAIEELHNFIENQYKIDNSSEINVSHGIILREIANLQKSLADQNNEECKNKHREILRQSLYYLDLATKNKAKVSPRILSRAYVTKGNVQNMLGDYSKALDAALAAIEVNEKDHSALFNAACYYSKLAEKYYSESDFNYANTLVNNAIKSLKIATDLNPAYIETMKTEPDFDYIKNFPAFKSISS